MNRQLLSLVWQSCYCCPWLLSQPMKELVQVFKILNVCADRVDSQPLYEQSIIDILRLCSLPYLKEKASDELIYEQIVVESVSQLGMLVCLLTSFSASVSVFLSVCWSVSLSLSACLCFCLWLSACLSLSVCLSPALSLSLSLSLTQVMQLQQIWCTSVWCILTYTVRSPLQKKWVFGTSDCEHTTQ